MSKPTQEELKKSIQELSEYRDRLTKEVVSIAKKLKMPQKKIASTLAEHSELKKIEEILSQMVAQIKM